MRERSKRILSIDILRGIVMVIMALDHTRDYFTDFQYNPLDLQHTTVAMFLTRWITHFCAPVFVFLAGTSVFLSQRRSQKTKKEASAQLLTRGLWLVVLELTIVRFGCVFNVDYSLVVLQVIWAIGCSMIFLALLVYLPRPLILTIGLVMILGHNAFDTIHASDFSPAGNFWWHIIHEQGPVTFGNGNTLFVIYPLVPWIGVMAVGYCFGAVFELTPPQRKLVLYAIGALAIAAFITLRAVNIYGDSSHWEKQDTWWQTALSFIDCTKYPPSLLYLLMTLGPAIFILPLLESLENGLGRFLIVYGRVPMFYYVLHIYLVHLMAVIAGELKHQPLSYFTSNNSLFTHDPHWGFPLYIVYAFWIAAVLLLYYPCRWFMKYKMSHKKWWLSYI